MNLWGEILEVIGEADGDMNVYNIYLQGDYDESDLSDFCNSEQAFEQFNLYQGTEWELCSNAVYMGFKNDLMKSYADDVATSLKEIPVLLYNGQFDLIVYFSPLSSISNGLVVWGKQEYSWSPELDPQNGVGWKRPIQRCCLHSVECFWQHRRVFEELRQPELRDDQQGW